MQYQRACPDSWSCEEFYSPRSSVAYKALVRALPEGDDLDIEFPIPQRGQSLAISMFHVCRLEAESAYER